ncbi:UDP-sugar:glycosyltransferase [Striga asiatica]|uniref:UDP-sugar:glycosyltransferase n=1 Tax=Striga asiatica TaxID=4170 RepID=A0A5A7R9M2_STRAF|nr:UDP-sugar:glycosyltransferase [Striga asiatica]
MENFELVFIPSPGLSHLVSTIEAAKLLLNRDPRLSVTILVMKLPTDQTVDNYTQTTPITAPRLTLTHLPNHDFAPSPNRMPMIDFINTRGPHVKEAVSGLISRQAGQTGSRVAGLVLDMFCTVFTDIADELGLPSYVFFTSGASALGLINYLVSLKFDKGEDLTRYKDPSLDLPVPCFSSPVPAKVLPGVMVSGGPVSSNFLGYFKRVADTRGVMVNTFEELEPFALESLKTDGRMPRVYPVGPVLSAENQTLDGELKEWLDRQPDGSVVFLCFGTMGSFDRAQVAEIAAGLEQSGARFLWSLRKPGGPVKPGGAFVPPTEYEDFGEVLPEGFLERTSGVGRVMGWAPQVAVLAHVAVGGFISHCGWNSTLESVWHGVPMATLPLYAEQQMNAFLLVRELGIAEAIRIDYRKDFGSEEGSSPENIVGAGEIEEAVRRLMAADGGGVREKVREMQGKSRAALEEGGSSYHAITSFIEDAAAVQLAELLVSRDPRLSVAIILMKLPIDTKTGSSPEKTSPDSRIHFVHLPPDESGFATSTESPNSFVGRFVTSQQGPVRDAVSKLIETGSQMKPSRLAGFVVDMFCTAMVDVAHELGVPSYVFFTCSASCLGLFLHLQGLVDFENRDLKEYADTDEAASISVPTYDSPVPARVWPEIVFDKESIFLDFARKFRETKGIIVNTFLELEPHAVRALVNLPPVYPVGPIIQYYSNEHNKQLDEITKWLDEKPDSSVVFLCFGSSGSFDADQVREIAAALERIGCGFLWSLRKPAPKGKFELPGEFENVGEFLPDGFLERTSGFGKVIGWAPQVAVLAHRAVGGFVSHCGWNSTLESVRYGCRWPRGRCLPSSRRTRSSW